MNRLLKRVHLLVLFSLLVLVCPLEVSAQPAPGGPNAPDAIASFFDDLKLGARVEGGVLRWGHTAPPLVNEELRFLKRPVSGDLSFITPLYGASGALRYHGAEVRVAIQANAGLTPTSHLHWRSGEPAIPLRPQVLGLEVQGRYWVTAWAGIEVGYTVHLTSFWQKFPAQINGMETGTELFDSSIRRNSIVLALPFRHPMGQATAFGRIGGTIHGSSRQAYEVWFVRHDESPIVPNLKDHRHKDVDHKRETSLSRQFVRVGVAYPAFGVTARLSGALTRADVPSVRADWHAEARLQVGLPF